MLRLLWQLEWAVFFDSSARLLDEQHTVKEAKLVTGTSLTLQVGKLRVGCTSFALSAILGHGSVVTWGNQTCGGDSRTVQEQLKGVQQIQGSRGAFAAILTNGSVVTWGAENYGGDSRAVQDQLKCVQQIQASHGAFAAILADGSIVTWGCRLLGGDSRAVQDQLKGVQ